jgi:hypothetical protein
MKIDIHANIDDGTGSTFYVGTVEVTSGIPLEEAQQRLDDAWGKFQETQPDTDEEFIGYLAAEHPKHFAASHGNEQFYCGGFAR